MEKILIAYPLYSRSQVNGNFIACLDNAKIAVAKAGYKVTVTNVASSLIHGNREKIAHMGIEGNFDYIMWFDSDIVFGADTILRLLAYKKDFISGMYFMKAYPYHPIVYGRNKEGKCQPLGKWPKDKVISVDAVGFGCVLMKVDMLRNMPTPYFCCPPAFLRYDAQGKNYYIDPAGRTAVLGDIDKHKQISLGEDMWFCYLAKTCGYDLWVDTGFILGHAGEHIFSEREYEMYLNEKGETCNDKD